MYGRLTVFSREDRIYFLGLEIRDELKLSCGECDAACEEIEPELIGRDFRFYCSKCGRLVDEVEVSREDLRYV